MAKMTKEQADKSWRTFPYHGDGSAWAEPVAAEFWRARSEEARLTAEVAEKDAQIKELAELLEFAYRDAKTYPDDVEAALRRAGVLK